MAVNVDSFNKEIETRTYGRDLRVPIHDALYLLSQYKGERRSIRILTQEDYDALSTHDPDTDYGIINTGYDESKLAVIALDSSDNPTDDVRYFEMPGVYLNILNYLGENPNNRYWIRYGRGVTNIGQVSVGNAPFSGVSNIAKFSFMGNVTDLWIGAGTSSGSAFSNCTNLKVVELGPALTSIPMYSFYGCTSLKSITIPDTTMSISAYAFAGCISLEEIVLPESITVLSEGIFAETGMLRPSFGNITSIGFRSFYKTPIESIEIPSSVTSISEYAFQNCDALSSIVIDKSQNSIPGSPWGATNATITWTG